MVIQYSIKTNESDKINVAAWKADQYAICITRRMYQNSTKWNEYDCLLEKIVTFSKVFMCYGKLTQLKLKIKFQSIQKLNVVCFFPEDIYCFKSIYVKI